MSEENEEKHLCITEDEFDKFQSVSMYQEEEYITLSDIVSPQPQIPDYGDMSQVPSDSEVVLTNNTPQENLNNEKIEESNLLKPTHYEDHTLLSNSSDKSQATTDILHPKKRGRKKKIIPTTPVDINICTDSQYLEESDKNKSLVVATKRGRMIKRPVHYNVDMLEKPKRGRTKKKSPSDTLLLSAADSTTVDNSSDNLMNNSDIPKLEEKLSNPTGTPSAKKRGRSKRMVSQSNNLSQSLESTARESSIDESVDDFKPLVKDSTSSIHKNKKLKKGNLELLKEADLFNSKEVKTSLENTINDDKDDMLLSQLKGAPELSKEHIADQSHAIVDNNVLNAEPVSKEQNNIATSNNKTQISSKLKLGRQGKRRKICKETSSIQSTTEASTPNTKISEEDDDTDNLCLSKLKKSLNVDTPSDNAEEKKDIPEQVDSSFLIQSQDTENIISSKRNSKMPIMSDFEYNIDSIMASNSKGEIDAEEDQPNRRRKAKQQPHNYHEESDEDPFANVELSDDEPQKRRKGHRYNSDDEYIPGSHSKTKKRKESVESLDSYDSDLISDELDELNGSKKKKRKGKSDNNSPRKKEQKISKGNDSAEIDDIEEVLQSSVITASTSSWSAINEFENFIAKKIQGTNIQIKKVSESTEQKAPLEIPVLIPEKKKLIEMCSQTDKIKTFSVGIQTSTGYDKPVKEKIALTNEQSENACQFLNSIVRTTAELGQLMTQKSEDFIQKKIHTQNITDTLKMDYCVKKSYLLFKLAKHNLMQMEEDLSKQYEEFLQKNNLSSCREEEKALIANPKTDNDSDCEIVEEPVNPNKLNASQFNPKTVFLNKELSIKIAKKPTDKTPQPAQTSQQKLNIKGRHSVWINDTVMVKKVKPTQSFLAQDSRNKKPPDSFVTEKMVSDFFTEYKRQHAYTICAPFVSSDWITNKTECICNYFVTQNTGFSPSAADADTTSNFVPETNVENDKSVVTMKTSPDSLFTLCFQLLNKIFTKSSYIHKPELNKVLFNEKNNSRQPPSLLQLSLENLILKRCESPTLPKLNTDTECVSYDAPLTVLPLRTICYKRMLELYSNNSVCEQLESSSDRCSGSEYYSEDRKDTFDIESIEENPDSDCLESDKEFDDSSYGIEMAEETEITPVNSNNEVRTLLSLCIKSIQKIQKRNYARRPERYPCSDEMECFEHVADDSLILTNNKVLPLFSLCVKLIQSPCKDIIKSCYTPKTIQSYNPKTLNYMAFQKVQQLLYCIPDINLPSPIGNMSPPLSEQQTGIDIPIVGVTINSVNTLSEEAYLNLVNVQTNVTNDTEYEDNFDDDNCDPYEEDHFESEFDAPQDRKQNWLTQVQIKEINPGVSSPITPEPEQESDIVIASIKLEPIETHFDTMPEVNAAMPTVDNTILIKSEAGPGLNEMTMIPDISHIKSEADDTNGIGIQRLNSNSYDCDTFENFVRSNKMMAAANYSEEDIFSQSALRVRRQHEPDLDDGNDMGMSLLIPQTFETINIDTAKGSLMESSSDEASKSKKNPGKKKIERKTRTKSKKTDPKVLPNKDTPSANKDKKVVTEVAVLTRRMRERIRQEEKKGDSTDSENETLYSLAKTDKSKSKTSNSEDEDETLYALPKDDKSKPNAGHDSENETLYSLPKKDKSKSKTSGKVTETAIQCNNVDSTANVVDEHDDVSEKFTGFTTIDQTETSSYQKFMKYVYDKIIPAETEDKTKLGEHSKKLSQDKESDSPLFKENEPVELLECEPTMPFFDDDSKSVTDVPKPKSKKNAAKSGTIKSDTNLSQEPLPATTDINAQFIERHGWKCYPVNGNDTKLSQTPCLLLEKLPETFVETYFQYCNITANKSQEDEEVDRLTNLSTLNRSTQLKEPTVREKKVKKDGKAEVPSEQRSGSETRTASACSDRGAELTPSEDEGGNIDDESAPLGPKQTDNILAKDSLMNDSDSDGGGKVTVKTEPPDETAAPVKKYKPGPKSKTRGIGNKVEIPEPGSLMLTADKMMNKELTLLHAPIVMKEGESSNPAPKKLIPRACKRSSPRIRAEKEKGPDDDYSSEEEKQWVNTKEKLLKRMGKKEDAIVDDAKRTKLVTDFIERRADMPDSHKRSRGSRVVRSRKKFLERQKQLKILSRELFGEPATDGTHKRSAQANFKGRRNIRKVIDKKSLARSTVVANMEEFERKKRLNNRQTRLRELLGCEEGVNVLVINDEVCLEYDFEEHRPVVTVHPFFTKVMKAHQYEGVKFMWDACFESLSVLESGHPGGGCILAHCMGLGKTLQVLALLHTVLTHPRVGMRRILVCCPLSTVLNWVDEIHKWIGPVTNEIKVFELSKLKKTYERAYQLEDWYNGGGIFIIGYELFRSLSTLDPFIDNIRPTIVNKIRTALLDPGPDIIVCDEGHLLKNDCSVLAVAMSRVVTKRRIVLTGTPMQNNLREYYCMVDFVKPNLLGTYSEYSNRFENPIMNGQHRDSSAEDIKLMKARTHILHKVLEGCLQRQEAAVLYPYLPKKHEYTLFIPLTKCQWDLYKHYINNCAKQSKQSILKDFHILHKIWSHPQVLHNFQTKARDERAKIKAEKLEDDLATEDQEEIKPNETDIWWLEHLDGGRMLEKLEASNKFVAVFRILDECVALGDKLLIFSTSLFCLDSLEYFLKRINNWSLGQEYFRLDGSVPPEVRQKWCREFNADNNVKTKLFLVSTRAGCLGLNMTAANRVIIMDTSWNPAHDIQSIFRVYRFGQKKDCFIYRLVAMGSMEQKIYERSVTKQAVACRVVDEQQIDRHYNSAELTELYMYDESGSSVAGGVAVGVQDVVLLRVARVAALHAVHEHDSLLRGSEPALPEHERVAAWQQFQQEQEDKQIQNSLGVYPPKIKIPLKRIYGPEIAKPENIKQEDTDTPNVATPTEAKPSKRRKKNLIVNCRIPVQVEDGNSEGFKPVLQHVVKTDIVDIPPVAIPEVPIVPVNNEVAPRRRGRPRKTDPRAGPSQAAPAPVPLVDNEEMMVEKITEVLLKHNIQNRKLEIGMLIASVKKVVAKGVPSDDKALRGDNELARSIAKILLEQSASQIKPSVVTDIVCESITNTVTLDHQVEEITGDIPSVPIEKPTNKYKPKPKRFKDKRVVDSPKEVVTESPVVYEPENRTKRKAALDAKKSIGNMSQDIVINLDEDDDSADVDFVPADDDEDCNSVQIKIEPEAAEVVKPTKKTPTKPESVVKTKTPSKAETVIKTKTPIIVKAGNIFATKKNKENNKKVEVRKPAPQISKKASDKVMTSIELSDEDEPLRPAAAKAVAEESTEEVPLPLSLLTNKNFIKIVAHTYLAGNPMLDEDAATLAAQYSTYRALKEAELSGKPILNGPIYDIALKILGPNILKKLQVVNDKKLTESNATVQQLQDNIQAIQAHLEPEPSTSSNKPKPKRQGTSLAPLKPVAAPSKVVPVGLISRAAPSAPAFTPQAPAEAEECILPDDDECIISDNTVPLQSTPEIQPTPTTSAARFPGDSSRQLFGTPTVSAATAATPVTAKHPRNVLKIFNGRVGMPSDPNQVEVQPDTDNTICLDSDDEDAAPVVPVSLTAAFSGVRLPLPNVPPNPAALGKPPIIFRAKVPTQVGPRVSTPRAITTENKILAKPGDLYVISDTGQVEVLSKEQVKTPGLEAGPRNLKPVSKPTKFVPIASKPVPIAPKPTTVAPKPAPIVPKPATVAPKPAPIATKPVPIAPKPAPIAPKPAPIAPNPNATVSKPVTQADTPIKPVVTNSKPDPPESSPETRRSTTIESDSSSDESSRSSSPENPLSILKDVVHIQAADDRPRRSRQKTEENTKSVQHEVTDVTKNKSSLSRSTTNSNRAVIDVSYAPSTSKNDQAESNKTMNTPSKPNVHTYTVKAKQLDKVPTKIVGTTKNIILDGTKGLKLTPTAVYTHNAKTIKLITTSTKPATDMKRGLPPTNSSVAKKTRKQPMTLKDFDIDDIDDIIELE